MVLIEGRYLGDLRCESSHGPSGASLHTDAPADNMGKGEAFSPTDLVATALEHEQFKVAATEVANVLAERFACLRVTNQMVNIIKAMNPKRPPMIEAGAAWKRKRESPPRFQMDSRKRSSPRV